MNKQNILWVVGLLVFVLGIVYLINSGRDNEIIKVAIQQSTNHVVFDQLIKGVKEGLKESGYIEGKNIIIELQNGQGDVSANQAIAQKFAKGDYNVYIPLGTQSSQAIVNVVKNKPVIFGAVTDPVNAKLIASNEAPGSNVTGTTDATNYKAQLELFKKVVPNLKKVGLVYNPSEANSVSSLKNLQALAPELGLEFVTAPVNNTNDILGAASSIAPKVDGFFMMPDNTVLAGVDTLIKVTLEKKKPFFAFESTEVKDGGLICIGTNYTKLGIKTGLMVAQVLKGGNTATMPIEGLIDKDVDVFVNQKTADLLGIQLPSNIVSSAKEIYK